MEKQDIERMEELDRKGWLKLTKEELDEYVKLVNKYQEEPL